MELNILLDIIYTYFCRVGFTRPSRLALLLAFLLHSVLTTFLFPFLPPSSPCQNSHKQALMFPFIYISPGDSGRWGTSHDDRGNGWPNGVKGPADRHPWVSNPQLGGEHFLV